MRGATLTQPRGSPPAPPSPGKSPAEQRCHAPPPSPKLARMEIAALPVDEDQRLAALRRYAILDTPPEASFDQLTRFASQLCATPIALVSLIDRDRQWFKASVGIDDPETPREDAFCAHTILEPTPLEVDDATADERFRNNPFVLGDAHVRFYAGMPLVTGSGHALGALCVIDRAPRQLDATQRESLRHLTTVVERLIDARALAAMKPERSLSFLTVVSLRYAIGLAQIAAYDYAPREATLLELSTLTPTTQMPRVWAHLNKSAPSSSTVFFTPSRSMFKVPVASCLPRCTMSSLSGSVPSVIFCSAARNAF